MLRGRVDEAVRNIDRAIAAGSKAVDLLMQIDLLWAAGAYEKCMIVLEENMVRFEAELTPRERKTKLDPVLRRVAVHLLNIADGLYAAEKFEECVVFAQDVLMQHAVFLKLKKHRVLFRFAWSSSCDEVLRRLYASENYESCVEAVDDILTHQSSLTTFWQRSRYRKLRALAKLHLGRFGSAMLDFLCVPGVQASLLILALVIFVWFGGFRLLTGAKFFSLAKREVVKQVETPANSKAPPSSPVVVSKEPAKNAARLAEIKSVKLFESGPSIPPVGKRNYQNQFSRQAGRIFVEVLYRNLSFRVADATIPLSILYYGPTGALLQEISSKTSPKKEYESAITSLGWRPEGEGGWPPGKYTVKVALEGEPLQELSFEIR